METICLGKILNRITHIPANVIDTIILKRIIFFIRLPFFAAKLYPISGRIPWAKPWAKAIIQRSTFLAILTPEIAEAL